MSPMASDSCPSRRWSHRRRSGEVATGDRRARSSWTSRVRAGAPSSVADPGGGRGDDVEVAGVVGQIVAATADLDGDEDPAMPAPGVPGVVELRVGAQVVARDVLPGRSPPSRGSTPGSGPAGRPGSPASGGTAQKTELRIISGGSTGLRMMIARPVGGAADLQHAAEVVSVNSSMFARVPGPADARRPRRRSRHRARRDHRGDGGDHRDRGLAAAGDHVDVDGVEVELEVDRGQRRGRPPRA